MPQAIRYTLLSLRDLSLSVGPFVVLALSLLALAYAWLDPNPPKHVSLATGPAQSAYDEFGKRYARALAQNGIAVKLVPTEGSAANLRLLREGKVDLGFVQGGSGASPLKVWMGTPWNPLAAFFWSRFGCFTGGRP
jgi:ABC-type transport system substrate-binding protein